METYYHYFLLVVAIIIGICIFFALIKSIIGPRLADRVVSVNMISTLVVMLICLFTVYYKQAYLDDVALIYVLVSFVSIVVLTNLFINVNMRKKFKQKLEQKEDGEK